MILNMGKAGLTWKRRVEGRFAVGAEALAILRRYIQNGSGKAEAGGVLLGRHILNTHDVVVDAATEPFQGDRRGRMFFLRAQARHQAVIDRAWRESGGTCTYVGEWHTHPEPYPVPSEVDWRDWKRKLREDRFTECLFFVILGTRETRVWEGARNGRTLTHLTEI